MVAVAILDWWVEPFRSEFMRQALFAGLLTVLSTSTIGTWVVLRGLSFLGDALAHGVLPGIAIAFILGINTTIGALAAAGIMVLGINVIRTRSPLHEDTSIGLLFVGFLALAVVILSSQDRGYQGDLNDFLFGSITGISSSDLQRQGMAAMISVSAVMVFHRAFLTLTFNETLAKLLGMRPRLAHAGLLVLLAVTIVTSFKTVGSLLVFAFLIAPPATATLLAKTVPRVMVLAVLIGAFAVVLGLLISFHYDTAGSATMALVSVVVYLLALSAMSLAGRVVPRPT